MTASVRAGFATVFFTAKAQRRKEEKEADEQAKASFWYFLGALAPWR